MTQMNLLDLLVAPEPHPEDLDPDTDVLGCFFAPWELARVVAAIDDPKRLKRIRAEIVEGRQGGWCLGGGYATETKGIQVRKWAGQPGPWLIPWRRVFAIIRERATPDRAEALRAATSANGTTLATREQWAAVHAILPNRVYLRWYR